MAVQNINNKQAVSPLNGGITAGATSFVVQSGGGANFPAAPSVVLIDDELIWYDTLSSDTFTNLTRQYGSTTAAIHADAASVRFVVASEYLLELEDGYPLTIKGDIMGRDVSASARLAVGTNDQIMKADSTQSLGLKWVDASEYSQSTRITFVDTPYTALESDSVILCNTAGGAIIVNLPNSATIDKKALLVKRITGGNNVTINKSGTDLIDLDGVTQASKSLNSVGASWSGVSSDIDNRWWTIGEHGDVV